MVRTTVAGGPSSIGAGRQRGTLQNAAGANTATNVAAAWAPGVVLAICDAARGRAPGRSCPDNRGRGPVLERGGPTNAAEGTPLAAEGTPTTTEGQGGAGGPARNPI